MVWFHVQYLPYDTHSFISPLLCRCLPDFDEICRRFLSFVRTCISHKTPVFRSVVCCGIFHGRSNSPIGRNVLFCPRRYGWAVKDILHSRSVDGVMWDYVDNSVSVSGT